MDCCDPPVSVDLEITAAEHDLAVRGFVALWHGQRPRPVDLDADPAAVDALQQRGLIVIDPIDPEGRITGIHGLSTAPTAHRITHADGDVFTWCAFDAIGIPAALGLDAQTRTTCPTCGSDLDVTYAGGQPTAEADLRLWLPTMQCDNVLSAVCAHANLYCDDQHLTATVADDAIGTILTVPAAADLGRATWQDAATALS
jgi:hypothetical protein